MRSSVIFTTIFAVGKALDSTFSFSEKNSYLALLDESFGKREDVPKDHNGRLCSEWEGTPARKVPRLCLEPLFCSKQNNNANSEDCGFNGQLKFPKEQIDKMSDSCVEQAICNVINSQKMGNFKAEQPKKVKRDEYVRDVELPGEYKIFNKYSESGLLCSEYLDEEIWRFAPYECYYNILCIQPVPADEPQCTTLDPSKKYYDHTEFTDLDVQCAREILCNRAKGEIFKNFKGSL